MPSPRAILRAPRAVYPRAGPLRPDHRRRRFRGVRAGAARVRFVVFPQIESYRDTLAGVLSRELGQPVEIAALATGWDGWNPKLVVQGFRVLDEARASPTPLLLAAEVE